MPVSHRVVPSVSADLLCGLRTAHTRMPVYSPQELLSTMRRVMGLLACSWPGSPPVHPVASLVLLLQCRSGAAVEQCGRVQCSSSAGDVWSRRVGQRSCCRRGDALLAQPAAGVLGRQLTWGSQCAADQQMSLVICIKQRIF